MDKVFYRKLDSYEDSEAVVETIASLLDNCGMDRDFSGKTVLIKPNMLRRCKPQDAITTDPSVVRAVLAYFSRHGAGKLIVYDSPGGVNTAEMTLASYRACGFSGPAEEFGAELSTDIDSTDAVLENGSSVPVSNVILSADVVINVCKLKTHAMAGLSAAAKNMFGAVPGTVKAETHLRFPDRDRFCTEICLLAKRIAPEVSICDAVVGMEGDGPAAGTPRKYGFLAASRDPFLLDRVLAYAIGMKPEEARTVESSISLGFAPEDVNDIDIEGDEIVPLKDVKRAKSASFNLADDVPGIFRPVVKLVFSCVTSRPAIGKNCVGCGRCAQSCPRKAITISDGRASIDYSKCIKCFCCHELCPQKAVYIKRGFLRKLK
ncbi:MAG: DUF362 domain-containing protein [Oscillospiraceae bacterium]|jgi:uncharacterized protein (DUF362 family)/NAD-dependent dihydropyrimidine dehydrogenase PreA subunit